MSLSQVEGAPTDRRDDGWSRADTTPDESCPKCGTRLSVVGPLRICVNCSYEALSVSDTVSTPDEAQFTPGSISRPDEAQSGPDSVPRSDEAAEPEDPVETVTGQSMVDGSGSTPESPPIWAPPPRPRGRLTTRLGFGADDPCPRMCGGILEEIDGAIVCPECSFSYSDAKVDEPGPLPHASIDGDPEAGGTRDAEAVGSEGTDAIGPESSSIDVAEVVPSNHEPLQVGQMTVELSEGVQSGSAAVNEALNSVANGPSSGMIDALEQQIVRLERQVTFLKKENRRLLHQIYELMKADPPSEIPRYAPIAGDAADRRRFHSSDKRPWWRRLTSRG